MKKISIILLSIVIVGVIAVGIFLSPKKINACKQIKHGITLEEFIDRFGQPINKTQRGRILLATISK